MLDLSRFRNPEFERGVPRWKEVLWWGVRSWVFAGWFPVPSAVKVMALRWFGAKVGKGVVIRSRVNITMPWRLEVGDHVWLGDEVLILSLAPVRIGSHCCVSQRAFLCTGSHDYRRPTFDLQTAPIELRDGTWVAAGAFVGPGVVAGPYTVIAAGAVVTKPVPGGMLAYGNPMQCRPMGAAEGSTGD